jgi:predicted nuclease of restriction endonuclease-like (RecB) superfamily
LSWSHYRLLIKVKNDDTRMLYMQEAAKNSWSGRLLEEQVHKHSLERFIANHKIELNKQNKEAKMELEVKPVDYVMKDPLVLDFLGLDSASNFTESDIEQKIIDNLQKFLLELGRGYSFVSRQFRIDTEYKHYFVDLVFYNYMLKCFMLIDIKIGKLTHQDVGQMDMYVIMFDDIKRQPDDNPTIGVILCEEHDKAEVRYSILHENEHLFASKYKLYLPTEQELIDEIVNARRLLEMGE